MKFVRIVVVLLCVFFVQNSLAQIDYLGQANAAFKDQRYFEAIDSYKKAYTKMRGQEEKSETIFQIAECYRLSEEIKQSIVWYSRAIKASYEDPIAIYHLATAQKLAGNYEQAIEEYTKFLELSPGDKKGKDGKRSCELSIEWIKEPTRYEVVNVPIINSEQSDFSPTFAGKKNDELIFTSTREGSAGTEIHGRTGENFPDLYYTAQDKKGKWSEPIPLNEEVNSEASEGSACLNSKKTTMYFTRCLYVKEGETGCQIYMSRKQGRNWSDPEIIPIIGLNDTNTVGQPAITADDKTLVFASDMPGGFGKRDLWYITDLGRGKWSEPVNLGSAINTDGFDLFPFIDTEGNLYFSSDGHLGMGGLDVFKATDAGNKQWGNVENLKYPINSNAHDFGLIVDGKETRGYLSSSRSGGVGGDDIWQYYLPDLVFAIEGEVLNKKTGEKVADATVQLKGTDGTLFEVKTGSDGVFVLAENGPGARYVKPNTSYTLMVSKDKFLNAKGNETTVDEEESKVFYHIYELQPIDDPIKLPQILYELAKWDLLPESKDSLNFLYDIMTDNPNIVIELSAHTDSRGSDAANKTLSQKRAQSCVNYLVEKGIHRDRMVAKGYGEGKLLITDAQISRLKTEEEKEAAHAKNRRTEFSVIREDFVPPAGSSGSN
jgi:peptidoglycan-associated lipoprotein